jgi:hypothetical protein
MTQVIIYTNENGNVSVCTPTGEISVEAVLAKDCPSHAVIVDRSSLPNEHYDFFNAWELNSGKVTVCHIKSQAITKERLRAERAPLLTALDVQYQRAQEDGRDTTIIISEKQRLRDVTKLADKATTLDELKALSA